jgi:preprotein translocase subunit SecD
MQDMLQIVMSRFIGGLGVKKLDVHLLQTNNIPTISIQMPSFRGNKQQTINNLLKTGELEFWDTGPGGNLTIGSTFDPSQYTQYNPGGKPLLMGHDFDPSQFGVSQEQSYNMIGFTMQDSAAKRFSSYTAQNIGHALTMVAPDEIYNREPLKQHFSLRQ